MFAELYKNEVFVTDKTGVKTVEILNANFVAKESSLFGKIDDAYLRKEVAWYDSEIQNIGAMEKPVPALWQSTAGHNGETNSNYGWAVNSIDNGDQFGSVVVELLKNPFSRRAIMIYTRPSMQHEYCEDGKNDFMCTNHVQYFIRNNVLETIVNMRSNDAVFGYKCDRHWQMLVRDRLFGKLKDKMPALKRGSIEWTVGSLHIYERHFYLIWAWMNFGKHDVSMKEYDELRKEYESKQMGKKILGNS